MRARLGSFVYAWRGLRALFGSEHNSWIHAAATLAALVAGLVLGLSRLEWAAVVVAVALVWIAEALNTAIEVVCDLVQPEPHPLVALAKDLAAGAVLVAAIAAAAVGLLVYLPHLPHLPRLAQLVRR